MGNIIDNNNTNHQVDLVHSLFSSNHVIYKLSDLKDVNAKKVILLQVLTGLLATSEAKCLMNVIFDYFSYTTVPIMAQFYGHYMIEVLTIFA